MPRTARASAGNYCYHVLNRGNARQEVFHKPEDYAAIRESNKESKRTRNKQFPDPRKACGYRIWMMARR